MHHNYTMLYHSLVQQQTAEGIATHKNNENALIANLCDVGDVKNLVRICSQIIFINKSHLKWDEYKF